MSVPGPEGIDTRHLDVMIESHIEELRRLGLPYDFATGLLEITDNAERDSERLAILAGVQLFSDAYQISQGQDPSRASIHAVPAADYGTGASETASSSRQRSTQAADLLAQLIGKERAESFLTTDAAVRLVRGLLSADHRSRQEDMVGKPRPEFSDALEMFVTGSPAKEIERITGVSPAKFGANKKTFIRRVVQKGLAEQVLAQIDKDTSAEPSSTHENTGDNPYSDVPDYMRVPFKFDEKRLRTFERRTHYYWDKEGFDEFPLSEPLTEDDALALMAENFFYPRSDGRYARVGRSELFAWRLALVLAGTSHREIRRSESTMYGGFAKAGVSEGMLSSVAPQFAVRFLTKGPFTDPDGKNVRQVSDEYIETLRARHEEYRLAALKRAEASGQL